MAEKIESLIASLARALVRGELEISDLREYAQFLAAKRGVALPAGVVVDALHVAERLTEEGYGNMVETYDMWDMAVD